MAEWSIAPVLKTDELRGSGGSNPSLSARINSRASDSNFVGSSFCIPTVSSLHRLRILFAPSHHTLPCRTPRNHTHTRLTVFPPGIIHSGHATAGDSGRTQTPPQRKTPDTPPPRAKKGAAEGFFHINRYFCLDKNNLLSTYGNEERNGEAGRMAFPIQRHAAPDYSGVGRMRIHHYPHRQPDLRHQRRLVAATHTL